MNNTFIFTLHTYLIGILVGLGTWFLFNDTLQVKAGLLVTGIATIATLNILHGYVRDEVTKFKTRRK